MSEVPVVGLKELGAMLRAYPPGKRIEVVVPQSQARGDVEVGGEVEVREALGYDMLGKGARAAGVVKRRAFIVEVTIPAEDALPEVHPGQATLG